MTSDLLSPQDFTPTGSIRWDSSWPGSAGEADLLMFLGYMEERFGIRREVFNGFLLLKTARSWHLIRQSVYMDQAVRLKVVQAGLKVLEQVGRFVKPTTRFIQIFGRHATKAVVDMNRSEFRRLLSGDRVSRDLEWDQGYVILSVAGYGVVGPGLFVRGEITSQLRARELAGLEW